MTIKTKDKPTVHQAPAGHQVCEECGRSCVLLFKVSTLPDKRVCIICTSRAIKGSSRPGPEAA